MKTNIKKMMHLIKLHGLASVTPLSLRPEININSIIITVALLASLHSAQAQNDKIAEALKQLKEGNLDRAKVLIDSASVNDQTSKSAPTWYYKGYIYYELYKRDKHDGGPERSLSIDYFQKSISLDPQGKYADNSHDQMVNIVRTFYNDAVIALNSKNPEKAEKSFEIYQKKIVIAEPGVDLKSKRIDVYLALGGMYTNLYGENRKVNGTYWNKAKTFFDLVLDIDPDNLNANYNLGILYYNKAVNIINGTDYDIDLVALSDIQDTSIILFRQSLPYMETALKLEPENENTLVGLSGIYFALNEIERSNEIKKKLEELKKKIEK